MNRQFGTRDIIVIFAVGFLCLLIFIFEPIHFSVLIGNSMEPTMSGGDIILYTDHTEISEGDVIVFENHKQDVMVGHRVIEIKGEEYITKGDNNSRPDPVVVTDENVEGKIIYHIPTPF